MSYLLTQMIFYMLGALLLGLLLGWILWGRRGPGTSNAQSEIDRLREENSQLRRNLEIGSRAAMEPQVRIAEPRATPPRPYAPAEPVTMPSPSVEADLPAPVAPREEQPAAALMSQPVKASPKKTAAKATRPKEPVATKPAKPARTAAKAPKAPKPVVRPDDLRRIIGIGPVNERLLHAEDVRTFAQIARWTARDVARIESVLQFDGRIERERWVEQAKLLAAGDEAAFARLFPTARSGKNT